MTPAPLSAFETWWQELWKNCDFDVRAAAEQNKRRYRVGWLAALQQAEVMAKEPIMNPGMTPSEMRGYFVAAKLIAAAIARLRTEER